MPAGYPLRVSRQPGDKWKGPLIALILHWNKRTHDKINSCWEKNKIQKKKNTVHYPGFSAHHPHRPQNSTSLYIAESGEPGTHAGQRVFRTCERYRCSPDQGRLHTETNKT